MKETHYKIVFVSGREVIVSAYGAVQAVIIAAHHAAQMPVFSAEYCVETVTNLENGFSYAVGNIKLTAI